MLSRDVVSDSGPQEQPSSRFIDSFKKQFREQEARLLRERTRQPASGGPPQRICLVAVDTGAGAGQVLGSLDIRPPVAGAWPGSDRLCAVCSAPRPPPLQPEACLAGLCCCAAQRPLAAHTPCRGGRRGRWGAGAGRPRHHPQQPGLAPSGCAHGALLHRGLVALAPTHPAVVVETTCLWLNPRPAAVGTSGWHLHVPGTGQGHASVMAVRTAKRARRQRASCMCVEGDGGAVGGWHSICMHLREMVKSHPKTIFPSAQCVSGLLGACQGPFALCERRREAMRRARTCRAWWWRRAVGGRAWVARWCAAPRRPRPSGGPRPGSTRMLRLTMRCVTAATHLGFVASSQLQNNRLSPRSR